MKKTNREYTELEKSYDAERIEFFNKEFFVHDMKILLDFSMFYVRKIMSIVYSNTFFGNTIYISQKTLERVSKIANGNIETVEANVHNCKLFIEFLKYDKKGRIKIIEIESESIIEYVKSQEDMVLYVSSSRFYEEAKKKGARVKLYNKHCIVYNERSIKYDTLGMLIFDENGKMYIQKDGSKPYTTKIVYDSWLNEKKGDRIKINIGDYVVVKKEMAQLISFIIYRVVNYHSKNNAIKLIWTDIENKDISENPYIKYPELKTLISINL